MTVFGVGLPVSKNELDGRFQMRSITVSQLFPLLTDSLTNLTLSVTRHRDQKALNSLFLLTPTHLTSPHTPPSTSPPPFFSTSLDKDTECSLNIVCFP